MAQATRKLITALRDTAERIMKSKDYQWGHMGSCNCGFLTQTITRFSKADVHAFAMRQSGDWSEQAQHYCSTSQMPFDLLLSEMLQFGFEIQDLVHLERLSDQKVLEKLPKEKPYLQHNNKLDVVLYIKLWADILESQLIEQPGFEINPEEEMNILQDFS
jgi:hypothetical protein